MGEDSHAGRSSAASHFTDKPARSKCAAATRTAEATHSRSSVDRRTKAQSAYECGLAVPSGNDRSEEAGNRTGRPWNAVLLGARPLRAWPSLPESGGLDSGGCL